MAVDHKARKPLFLGALYCEEGDDEQSESENEITSLKHNTFIKSFNPSSSPLLLEYDDDDDDEHLQSLLIKERERETSLRSTRFPPCAVIARKQGVETILRIRLLHGFSASAAIVAVNFLDRFLLEYCLRSGNEDNKPWLVQLVAVACLSLAAKVEETHVPLLLDLQGEDAEYLFEAKTIQRMEVMILCAMKWRMNPVTPISFIDHIVKRLGLKSYVIQLEFLRSCENTILSVISDSRIVNYLPSVVATATMLSVVHRLDYCGVNAAEYEKTMFQVLKISKEEVEECHGVISDDVVSRRGVESSKRKIWELSSDAVRNSDNAADRSSSSPFKKTRS